MTHQSPIIDEGARPMAFVKTVGGYAYLPLEYLVQWFDDVRAAGLVAPGESMEGALRRLAAQEPKA